MKLISINAGLPQETFFNGMRIPTGIFKQPLQGKVQVRTLNVDGDRQADLKVHGGPDKAVYLYPSEHYEFWRRELTESVLAWGAFGENLTVDGLSEDTVSVGDTIAIGTAVFQVTQPRLPCFKLAAKFQREAIIKQFLDSRRTGFYLRVVKEGAVEAGDPIVLLERDPHGVTIREITDLYLAKEPEPSWVERALAVDALAESWREHFKAVLSRK